MLGLKLISELIPHTSKNVKNYKAKYCLSEKGISAGWNKFYLNVGLNFIFSEIVNCKILFVEVELIGEILPTNWR